MPHTPDDQLIENTCNTARFFTENRQLSWVLLIVVIIFGFYSYAEIPKRKDPEVPVRVASVVTPWPGTNAETIEQLVTRQIEETIAESSAIHPSQATSYGIKSLTLPGVSIIKVQLSESINDTEEAFNDINLKLKDISNQLPPGAGPIDFNSGFGETAALLLTVASPSESAVEIALRARSIRRTIEKIRSGLPSNQQSSRTAIVVAFPRSVNPTIVHHSINLLVDRLRTQNFARDIKTFIGPSFVGLDAEIDAQDTSILARVNHFLQIKLGFQRFHPDAWDPIIIHDPADVKNQLTQIDGDKYSYADLDNFSDLISRNLQAIEQVAKVRRSGIQQQQVLLNYSQTKLAAYGVKPANIKELLAAYNTTLPGGLVQVENSQFLIDTATQFSGARQIGDVVFSHTNSGTPVYLRDLVEIQPGYQNPPNLLNYYSWPDSDGLWHRSRSVSLAVLMRKNQQINSFGTAVDSTLSTIRAQLPTDLIIARVSDQPRQVSENLELFMTALYEAIILVVLVAFLGFREWRSAVLLMVCIPITLALTFVAIYLIGIELQQVSVATLIIALGLLVDDPVVAGDAIKRNLADGWPRKIAAWLGPTKLASVIMFATITNVVAYMPFLMLSGNTGDFLRSLPVVMACALIASRLVSMTFVPFLGYYLLRSSTKSQLSMTERRSQGFSGFYYRVGNYAIKHRYKVLSVALVFLFVGGYFKLHLKTSFFPDDIQYISYVDIWLRNDASVTATNAVAKQAEKIIYQVTAEYQNQHTGDSGNTQNILESVSAFIGGGAPRFWFTVTPELQQPNYAQLVVRVKNKNDTPILVSRWQQALSEQIPGAFVDVRQLQTNPVKFPVAIRLSGRASITPDEEAADILMLKNLARQVVDILNAAPAARRVRQDWGDASLIAKMNVQADRASLAGITNQDIASSTEAGLSGVQVSTLRQGNRQIPIVARLWPEQRATLAQLKDLYIYSSENTNKIPLPEIASIDYRMKQQRIRRLEQFRTVTVIAFPMAGALPSDIFGAISGRLENFANRLPAGYDLVIAGSHGHSVKGFKELAKVMVLSAAAIFVCLVFQFKNAIKPMLVFAAVPFGMVSAIIALYIMGFPFSFMAFLGIVSLIGVIVSHVILLFDFIEERREQGEPFQQALLDAGILRLRPVLVTVGATVMALVPLAIHGGPLWQPLCYAQIGGLLVATVITLVLVPVLYAVFVLDLKIIRWEPAVQ